MSEKSPGQAAYEAFQRAFPDEDWGPWDMLDGDGHEGWEAAAQAAIAAAMKSHWTAKFGPVVACDHGGAPEVQIAPCPVQEHDGSHLQVRTWDHWLCSYMLARMLAAARVLDDPESTVIRERLDKLAASLEESAAKTEPSKKSDIERQTARRVRDIAGRPF